jgi:hypothetical protein
MTNRLNTYCFVPKGLNVNNPVRSAGKNILPPTAAPEGLNHNMIIFNSFRAAFEIITYRAFHTRLLKFNPFGALSIKTDTQKIIF